MHNFIHFNTSYVKTIELTKDTFDTYSRELSVTIITIDREHLTNADMLIGKEKPL